MQENIQGLDYANSVLFMRIPEARAGSGRHHLLIIATQSQQQVIVGMVLESWGGYLFVIHMQKTTTDSNKVGRLFLEMLALA